MPSHRPTQGPLRLGFVPVFDAAPLLVARELGLYARYGLDVVLSREAGWATIRDKTVYGEIDAAYALAPMPMAITLGLGTRAVPCITSLILSIHGDSITFSQKLLDAGVRDPRSFEEFVRGRKDPVIFGIPFPYSCHAFLLRSWLQSGSVRRKDVLNRLRFVVVPPPQMAVNLRAGHLDGYCASEPWNIISSLDGSGKLVARSADIAPGHPEKVLMTTRRFAEERAGEHEALIAVLVEACAFCEDPANRDQIVEILSQDWNLDIPAKILRHAEGTCFHGPGVHLPDEAKARWVVDGLRDLAPGVPHLDWKEAFASFRPDLYEKAMARRLSPTRTEAATG